MCTSNLTWNLPELPAFAGVGPESTTPCWFAIHTRSRHEKVVAQDIRDKGLTVFLPLMKEERRWSDRRKIVEAPLFTCYVFVNILPKNEDRLRVLGVDGVVGFVGTHGWGIPIPDEQMHTLQAVVEQQMPLASHPFLEIGQRVRVRSGSLAGVEGILVGRSGDRTLVISLDAIQRSLSVRIEGYDVEPV